MPRKWEPQPFSSGVTDEKIRECRKQEWRRGSRALRQSWLLSLKAAGKLSSTEHCNQWAQTQAGSQVLGVSFLSKLGYIIQLQLPACETREGTGVMEDANALYSSTHQVLSNSVNLFNSTNPLACCQWFMGWQALMGPFQLWRETRLLSYQHPILTLTLGASNIPTERT